MSPENVFIYVNGKLVSIAAFAVMAQADIRAVDANGCTALTELRADAATIVYASGCTALTELKADAATIVDASGCTALTRLKADAATIVNANGCTALTELRADAATIVYASGCTALTELKADAAEYVDASGCTALTGYEIFDAGTDARGYAFSAIKLRGEWRIIAGCRNFNLKQARHHWGLNGDNYRPDCLVLVEKLALAMVKTG